MSLLINIFFLRHWKIAVGGTYVSGNGEVSSEKVLDRRRMSQRVAVHDPLPPDFPVGQRSFVVKHYDPHVKVKQL